MTHSELESWKWLWRRIAQLHKLFLICILLAVAESLTLPPIAWLIRRILDIAIPAKDSRQLVLLGLCIVAFNLASAGLAMGTRFLSTRTTKIAIGELRKFLIQRSFELPRSAHDTLDRGDLHALFVQDTQLVDVMINESLSILIPSAIISVLLVTVLAVVNFRLLFVLILVVPLLYLVNFRLKSVTMAWSQRARDSFARLSTGIHFVLQKLDLTRYQNAEHLEIRRQGNLIDAQRVDGEKMVLLQFGYAQLQSTIVATAGILILVVGGMQVEAGNLSLGTLLSFYVIFAMLGSNLQKLFGAIPHIVSGNQSLCALHSFCSLHVAPPYSGTTRFKFGGDIELYSVSFRYKSKDVFRGLSIKLNSGSFTAIMGPNGEGKTTIARLILGLYRPDEGVLRADGISYEELDIEQLRQSISFTPQDPVLFSGTIWDNVSYGIPEEDAVHVKRACEIALVDDFVRYLPGGYNTEVGEDGGSLSGGQRQRIAIARALARRPRLLILDEPTNHLDPFTAQQLFRNLKSMLGACTALIITQDPAVARQTEFLYRLENGNLQSLEGASRFDSERIPEAVEREMIR